MYLDTRLAASPGVGGGGDWMMTGCGSPVIQAKACLEKMEDGGVLCKGLSSAWHTMVHKLAF